jgi:endo-1,4-beta-xylanase
MVAFTPLVLALSAAVGSLAAPAADPVAAADAPDFELNANSLARRQDYNQNYKTSGNVNFSPTNNGYSVQFSNAGDFVVGKGWKTGTNRYDARVSNIA